MRHVRTITICLAACAAAALAAGVSGAGASTPVAKLRGFVCQRSVNPVGRGVAVSAVMRPLIGTRRLSLRFELLTRTKAGGPWTSVPGGDIGAWLTPRDATLGRRPGDVWIVKKSVNELAAPAAYKYRVSFRWSGTRNRTLGTAVRTSPTCSQPELRPDLLVRSIDVQPVSGHPHLNLYVATIANGGATAAKRFRVQFFTPANGGASKYKTIKVLASHASTTVAFEGAACSTSAASTITVDPDGVVNDYNRDNNTMTAMCSSASGHA
jgi:hypothetical protein